MQVSGRLVGSNCSQQEAELNFFISGKTTFCTFMLEWATQQRVSGQRHPQNRQREIHPLLMIQFFLHLSFSVLVSTNTLLSWGSVYFGEPAKHSENVHTHFSMYLLAERAVDNQSPRPFPRYVCRGNKHEHRDFSAQPYSYTVHM